MTAAKTTRTNPHASSQPRSIELASRSVTMASPMNTAAVKALKRRWPRLAIASLRASRPGSRPVSGQRWRNSWLSEAASFGASFAAVVTTFAAVSLMMLRMKTRSNEREHSTTNDRPRQPLEEEERTSAAVEPWVHDVVEDGTECVAQVDTDCVVEICQQRALPQQDLLVGRLAARQE